MFSSSARPLSLSLWLHWQPAAEGTSCVAALEVEMPPKVNDRLPRHHDSHENGFLPKTKSPFFFFFFPFFLFSSFLISFVLLLVLPSGSRSRVTPYSRSTTLKADSSRSRMPRPFSERQSTKSGLKSERRKKKRHKCSVRWVSLIFNGMTNKREF